MAGRPPKIEPGSARWKQLQSWVLPAPRGEGLSAAEATARAEKAGWDDVGYDMVYRLRRQILAAPPEAEARPAKEPASSGAAASFASGPAYIQHHQPPAMSGRYRM